MAFTLNETAIKALEEKGFKRWTKGNFDRLYINADSLGLVCDFYKTGNIHYAELDGEKISNTKATALYHAKTWIDIATGELHGTSDTLLERAENILNEFFA